MFIDVGRLVGWLVDDYVFWDVFLFHESLVGSQRGCEDVTCLQQKLRYSQNSRAVYKLVEYFL